MEIPPPPPPVDPNCQALIDSAVEEYRQQAAACERRCPTGPPVTSCVTTGKFDGVRRSVVSLGFSHDGSRLVSTVQPTGVKIWDPDTRSELKDETFGGGGAITVMAVSPTRSKVVVGFSSRKAVLWNWETDDQRPLGVGVFEDRVTAISFSPDGNRIVTASEDQRVIVWDRSDGNQIFSLGHQEPATAVAYSPNGELIATASARTIHFWDADIGILRSVTPRLDSTPNSVSFSPDNNFLLTGVEDGNLHIWDLSRNAWRLNIGSHSSRITSVTYSPDNRQFASTSADGTLKVWGLIGSETLITHIETMSSVAFSPDGRRIAASGNNLIELFRGA